MPAEAVALYQALCVDFDLKRGQEIWQQMIPFTHLFYAPTGLGAAANDLEIWRTFLNLSGQHGGYSRAPFYPLTESQREQVKTLMQQQNLI
jgi:dihydrodipicolinate synthase/N-acetylneuraminate lyase